MVAVDSRHGFPSAPLREEKNPEVQPVHVPDLMPRRVMVSLAITRGTQ